MAKQWRNKSSTIELQGFEEFYEKLEKAGKDAEAETKKMFEQCVDNIRNALYDEAKKAGLAEHLLNQITAETIIVPEAGWWEASVGWKKSKPKKPLPDTYKVVFLNYGTPSGRSTKQGGQRVEIDGKWVTLGTDRGEVTARGFIKRAKNAAKRKNKKLQKEALERILGELE